MQVQTVKLDGLCFPTPALLHHLAEALCSMPNLSDLTLGIALTGDFYSALKAKASSMQGCFPQIRKGNFKFNGFTQNGLNSFLHTLSRSALGYHGNTYNTGNVSSEQSRAMYQGTMASTSHVNPLHANITLSRGLGANISVLQDYYTRSYHASTSIGDVHYPRMTIPPSNYPQQQPMGDVNYPRMTIPPSNYPQQQSMGDVHYPRRTLPPSDHPQQQSMGDVHYPRRTFPPSDYPQRQPMGDVHSPRRALPPPHYPQQKPMGYVNYLRRSLPPSEHPQQQPMGGVHYPRRTLPPSDHPQQQPMGDVNYPRRTLPSSDHPQQQPMGDVHYPRRALPPSPDHP
ncbi:early nodulin-75-like [Strongylocentrotus purpuratus]|uniref:Uncharacterized protein n=1 Tax=Strongylocentrotus purpuratus TaxID=7668 RepID=A0A7M7NX02_STRPU|nr:early nodulin-75-like [Strongylocentrotus purpuratus]